jgi:methionyl-tRNA formyltransferase
LLPYNKGADPNLWSFLEDTPKGVSIHFIDKGVDTGDILAQREIIVPANATLRTSYDALSKTIEHLFMETWPRIREGKQKWHSQSENGSKHRLKEKAAYEHLLTEGWDTPVKNLIGKALLEVS